MPDVVWLKDGEEPPEGKDWALVARNSAGRRRLDGETIRNAREAVFCIPDAPSEVDRSEAIAMARAWAAKNDVETVYVEVS